MLRCRMRETTIPPFICLKKMTWLPCSIRRRPADTSSQDRPSNGFAASCQQQFSSALRYRSTWRSPHMRSVYAAISRRSSSAGGEKRSLGKSYRALGVRFSFLRTRANTSPLAMPLSSPILIAALSADSFASYSSSSRSSARNPARTTSLAFS